MRYFQIFTYIALGALSLSFLNSASSSATVVKNHITLNYSRDGVSDLVKRVDCGRVNELSSICLALKGHEVTNKISNCSMKFIEPPFLEITGFLENKRVKLNLARSESCDDLNIEELFANFNGAGSIFLRNNPATRCNSFPEASCPGADESVKFLLVGREGGKSFRATLNFNLDRGGLFTLPLGSYSLIPLTSGVACRSSKVTIKSSYQEISLEC